MMDVLNFTFQSFWHWLGVFFLIAAFGMALDGMFRR